MLKTISRLNLVVALNERELDLSLLKKFESEHLLRLCANLDDNRTAKDWYCEQRAIQKELCADELFFLYLEKAMEVESIKPRNIDDFLSAIHAAGKKAVDFPIERVVSSMATSVDNLASPKNFYSFLSCFSGLCSSDEQKETIMANLALYQERIDQPVEELPAKELALFSEKALTNRDLVPDNVQAAFTLLAEQEGLLEIANFFFKNNIDVSLGLKDYKSFCQNPSSTLERLEALYELIGDKHFQDFVYRWTDNHSPYYELEALGKRFSGKSREDLADAKLTAFNSKSSYTNFVYGDRFKKIVLSEVSRYAEDILIYAISNKKAGFIRLVEDNFEIFQNIGYDSILFRREFYENAVNINALNIKNLIACDSMSISKVNFEGFDNEMQYTFDEVKALYGLPIQYYKLYAKLGISRIDTRLRVFRQLSKHRLLDDTAEDNQIEALAKLLSSKMLSAWRDENFSHIVGIRAQETMNLLIHWGDIWHLAPQLITRNDAVLVARNHENAKTFASFDALKLNIIDADQDWKVLVDELELSKEFVAQYTESIVGFLCENGASVVRAYLDGLKYEKYNKSLKMIVKAQLMGAFDKLKYHADDLSKELDFAVSSAQKAAWMENTEMHSDGGFSVKERDGFFDTILMGVTPQSTCLSYKNGVHKECLLSSFDSNKKILYAYEGGQVIGRAVVRLTKGGFGRLEAADTSFSFVDLENSEYNKLRSGEEENKHDKEQLIIFLERSYSARTSNETARLVDDAYIELMAKKSDSMGATLVISNSYGLEKSKDFVRTTFHVYISKSKAGAQYLDSLSGSATVSDEGGYRTNSFYIHKDDVA